jgi:hypothetical protein
MYEGQTPRWVKDTYPCDIKMFGGYIHQRTLSIGELTGSIEDLEGPIGELGVQPLSNQLLICTVGDLVIREVEGLTGDVDNDGDAVDLSILIDTPEVAPAWPFQRTSVVQVQAEYEASQSCDLELLESDDGGTTWTAYDSVTAAAGTGTRVAVFRRFIDRARVKFRLQCDDAPGFKLRSLAVAAHNVSAPKAL